jgi:hypothetical protein
LGNATRVIASKHASTHNIAARRRNPRCSGCVIVDGWRMEASDFA